MERVAIPANSTIGFGFGSTADGMLVVFVGDQRPMRDLGEALAEADEPISIEVPDETIVAMGMLVQMHDVDSNGA